jgi:hypothetical protein
VSAQQIISILKPYKLAATHESYLQVNLQNIFNDHKLEFTPQVCLGKTIESRIDFMFPDGLGIELKIQGSARSIYDQCLRYCKYEQVKSLLLVTSKSMGFPKEINGKPTFIFNLSKGWL